jgi:uncharacterized protein YbjQ (UPF0145 family)
MADQEPLEGPPPPAALPPAALARMAEIRQSGTWGSALSTHEFAAIRSVGFEPVGQVLGAAIYNIGFAGGYSCPTFGIKGAEGLRDFNRSHGYAPIESYTQVSASGSTVAYGPLVKALLEARSRAIARMVAECQALGGHGVVGISLTIERTKAGLEFMAIGTAVRAQGAVPLAEPFTSGLSGQEFAKLLMSGTVPVGLVVGISIGVRHDDLLRPGQARWMIGNIEVPGYTDLVNRTRRSARMELLADVGRVGGEGVVVHRNELNIGEQECRGQERRLDYRAEVTLVGTAIAEFAPDRRTAERPSLAILSMDQERRGGRSGGQAVRASTVGEGTVTADSNLLDHQPAVRQVLQRRGFLRAPR